MRVNLVSAGPLETVAARGIPGFDALADRWREQAPLGWDTDDPGPVAGRDLLPALATCRARSPARSLKVDGGYSAVGAPPVARRAATRGAA